MSQLIPLYDLNQLNDFVDLPLPTIVKAKAGHELATFDIYEQRDIAMELSITDAPAFLLYESGEIKHKITGDIPGQVQEFIEKAEEALH
ncbi:hypothetical protein E3Q10_03778 [Wallemia mellicola]|uniref:Thioredoxin domain-containing protein n=1 Tax=Wallemia mellicola TaxID=1708541 RepID=A0A4T0QIN1_9BASI|nr:hypothetical protein E3Q11_03680 [Wallemia mellicola]TIC25378.1 hypothetical protein E3Q10_03778 [Wallemia mellicola]